MLRVDRSIANHLFVYWDGELIYERWLDKGLEMVFDPYGLPFVPIRRVPAEVIDRMGEGEIDCPVIGRPEDFRPHPSTRTR